MVGPILALLVIVIGVILLWKIYKLAEHLLPPPPAPPPPPATNSIPPTNIPATNCADAAWFEIGHDTNAPTADPFDTMYGLMPGAASLTGGDSIPVVASGAFESAGGAMLDTSNVLSLIRQWYGVGPDQYQPNNAAHSEWDWDTNAMTWIWVTTPATNLSFDPNTGNITIQEWTRADSPRPVILQRSSDYLTWTNLETNLMRAGEFRLYRDAQTNAQGGFYRVAMPNQ